MVIQMRAMKVAIAFRAAETEDFAFQDVSTSKKLRDAVVNPLSWRLVVRPLLRTVVTGWFAETLGDMDTMGLTRRMICILAVLLPAS